MNSELTPLELDALKEIFNIGIGRSASAMNQMVSEEVELTIPEVSLISHQQAKTKLISKNTGTVSAVTQDYRGDFSGQAMLMFSQDKGLTLVRKLLGEDIPLASLSDLEQDSLVEIGNIILNACFGTIINFLKADMEIDLPRFIQGTVEEIYKPVVDSEWSLYIEVSFSLPSDNINGYISFLMDIRSLEVFKNSVKNFVSNLSAA